MTRILSTLLSLALVAAACTSREQSDVAPDEDQLRALLQQQYDTAQALMQGATDAVAEGYRWEETDVVQDPCRNGGTSLGLFAISEEVPPDLAAGSVERIARAWGVDESDVVVDEGHSRSLHLRREGVAHSVILAEGVTLSIGANTGCFELEGSLLDQLDAAPDESWRTPAT